MYICACGIETTKVITYTNSTGTSRKIYYCGNLACKTVLISQIRAVSLTQQDKTAREGFKLWHKCKDLMRKLKSKRIEKEIKQ